MRYTFSGFQDHDSVEAFLPQHRNIYLCILMTSPKRSQGNQIRKSRAGVHNLHSTSP